MSSVLRSIASVILGILLWFILYLAFLFICALVLTLIPSVTNVVDFLVRTFRAEHWYNILAAGVPAIVPAIVIKQIMKYSSEDALKWTLIILVAIIAIIILVFSGETLSLLDRLEGVFGVGVTFFLFTKE